MKIEINNKEIKNKKWIIYLDKSIFIILRNNNKDKNN